MQADVIVVGLGAMGAATLYQLARSGVRALGIDRFAPPHTQGSSHGETRITRQGIGEGPAYTPLALRAHEIWDQLEAETGAKLIERCGCLVMGSPAGRMHGKAAFLETTIAVAEQYGIPHETLDAAGIAARFPQFSPSGDETGYFEPGGGMLFPERCIATQLAEAERLGATILRDETVTGFAHDAASVTVTTDKSRHAADKVVVAAGAWMPRLLAPVLGHVLVPHRQVLHWFAVDDAPLFAPARMPVFIWVHGTSKGEEDAESCYGLPSPDGEAAVKLGTDSYEHPCDPDTVDRTVAPGESASVHAHHLAPRIPAASARCVRSAVCLYTVSPDGGFLVGPHPEHVRMILVSACSGHGFKHSAAMGEALAQMAVEGRSRLDLSSFALDRFGARLAAAD